MSNVIQVVRSGRINAWKQHHTTQKVTKELLRYEIQEFTEEGMEVVSANKFKPRPKRIVFQLIDGPTGYESFILQDGDTRWDPSRMIACGYWSACAGTKGRWHSLRINAKDMQEALSEYLPENHNPHPLAGREMWAIGIEHGPGEFGMTHGPMAHIAWMLDITGQENSCIIHFFGDGTEEITHRWRDGEWEPERN